MDKPSMGKAANTTEEPQWTCSIVQLKCVAKFITSSEGRKFLSTHASNPLEFLDSIIAIRARMLTHLSTHHCMTLKEPKTRTS